MPLVSIVERDDEKTVAILEGQIYNFDDRTGFWTPWSVRNLIGGYYSVLHSSHPSTKDNKRLGFQKRQITKVNTSMYKYGLRQKFKYVMSQQFETESLGGSSFNLSSVVKDFDTGTILVERVVKMVTVDEKTRKRISLPGWFVEKHSGKKKLNDLSEELKVKPDSIPSPPKDCYKWVTTVRYSDMDGNQHTNDSVYMKLCLDAATDASIQGKLKHFTGDILKFPVEKVDITFIGESFPKDELTIYLWQDEIDGSVLHFIITKGGKTITTVDFKIGLSPFVTSKL